MVLKKGSARSRLELAERRERRDEVASSLASGTEELSTEEEGASLNDKVT